MHQPHHRPARVFGYCRVSTDEQGRHGTSLGAQEEEVRRYAAARGWPEPVIRREVASGSAAKLSERVELAQLLDAVRPGDAVLVSRVDRWGRDLVHVVDSVRTLVAKGVAWISIGDSLDAATPHGQSTLGIMAWSADQERMRIAERTVGRRREMRNAGIWTEGVAPRGYRRDPATRRLVIDEDGAGVVRGIFERCIDGESIAAIARSLRANGARWADKKAVHSILRARWYLGEIRRTDGVWIRAHEPIVDLVTFQAAQTAMQARRLGGRAPSSSSRTDGWLLRGLLRCGSCGARVGAAYSRTSGTDGYYVCSSRLRGSDCDEPYARASTTDQETERAVVRRLETLRRELSEARPLRAKERVDVSRVDGLRASLEAARQRRARAVSLIIDGIIDADEGRRRTAALDAELASLETELRREEQSAKPLDRAARREVLADVRELRERWGGLSVQNRRAILALLAERIELGNSAARVTWASVESLVQATVGRILFFTTLTLVFEPTGSSPTLSAPVRRTSRRTLA